MLHWLRSRLATKAATLASPDERLLALFGALPTAAGITISPETALKVPAVACAVRVVSESVAQLPVIVYRRGTGGAHERATDHPAYGLIHGDANSWQSSYDLKLLLQTDALLHGDGLAFVNRVRGVPREIIRLAPGEVAIERGADGGPVYRVAGGRELARGDVIHIKGLSTDGIRGKAAIRLAAEAIAIAASQEGHAGRLFGSGGRPSGVLKVPNKLSVEAAKRIAAAWAGAHAGENAGRTAVLEEGAEFQPLTFNSVDLQFLELRKFQIDEIARAFRVPPHLLYELGRATWSNSEEMGEAFLTYTLLPWLEQWEGALRRALFTPEERREYHAEFLVDQFNRADTVKRATAYSTLIAARVLNPNEARARENLPPYAGGDAFLNPNVTPGAAPPAGEAGGTP